MGAWVGAGEEHAMTTATLLSREQLIETLRTARAEWEALIAQVPEARLTEPGAEDAWSVKDVLAHIAAYERWTADQLAGLSRGETSMVASRALPDAPGMDDRDRRNAAIFEAHHRHSLARVRAEAADAFARLLELIGQLPEETLAETRRYRWTGGLSVAEAIASDSYEHYAQHAPAIRTWLARR
jgi:hypothetical protein